MSNTNKIHSSAGFYRPDIDGMRALAVSLVIADHLQLPHFAGGFVGVDIFFVISGYLISSIILRELAEDRFSIVAFYERRIRRIIPALLVVLLFTSAVAWFYMLPANLLAYGRSLLAAVFSVSNVYFSGQAGYFDVFAVRSPLLHTWSLGVEEQFYLAFPLLLALLFRLRQAWVSRTVILLAALSFLASATLVYRFPTQTFYLAPTRAWEFLAGTLLAMNMVRLPQRTWARNLAGVTALLLILAATFGFHGGNHFPGVRALLPCGGAVLLILAGQQRDGLSYRLLSLKPVVFIGSISYSLYLWHWPIISLRTYNFQEHLHLGRAAVDTLIIVESLVAGTLSWWLVETPFRRGGGLSRTAIFTTAALAAAAVSAIGVCFILTHGAPARFSPESLRIAAYEEPGGDPKAYRLGHCFIESQPGRTFSGEFDEPMCLPQSSTKPTILIVGNSHAAHLWLGLSTVFPDINWQQITGVGCLPNDDVRKEGQSCEEMRNFLFRTYLSTHHVDAVLLSSSWEEQSVQALGATLDQLTKFHLTVYVAGPIQRYSRPLPEILVDDLEHGDREGRSFSAYLAPDVFSTETMLKDVVRAHPGVHYISIIDLLCPARQCIRYTPDGVPLQSDDSHLTPQGSVLLAQKLRQASSFAAYSSTSLH